MRGFQGRTRYVVMVLTAVLMVFLVGCGPQTGSPQPSDEQSDEQSGEQQGGTPGVDRQVPDPNRPELTPSYPIKLGPKKPTSEGGYTIDVTENGSPIPQVAGTELRDDFMWRVTEFKGDPSGVELEQPIVGAKITFKEPVSDDAIVITLEKRGNFLFWLKDGTIAETCSFANPSCYNRRLPEYFFYEIEGQIQIQTAIDGPWVDADYIEFKPAMGSVIEVLCP